MKTIKTLFSGIPIFALSVSFTISSCGSTKKTEETKKKIVTKENLLDGLHIPEKEDGLPINFLSKTTPAYTEDAVEISRDEMQKKTQNYEYTAVPYVNDKNEMVLWLVRLSTEKEKKNFKETQNRMINPANLKGKTALEFDVKDMSGNSFSLKKLKGKVIVMNFWFIGCRPCVMEIPDLNALVDKCKGKDVVFLGFALDEKKDLEKFLQKTPFKYSIIPNCKTVSDSYQIFTYPSNLVIDQNLTVVYHTTGLDPNAPKDMLAEVDRLTGN
jgi:peroxiredoxin